MASKGDTFGPYQIVSPLGSGGMGAVYVARDTRLGRAVAIKFIHARFADDPEYRRRFEQEARAAGNLNHPNIVVIHDVGEHEGAPYLVMELLQGESLAHKLERGRLPASAAIDYARQIADGLAAAHARGIIHRDLKPANLFLTTDGRVKILDFGLAKPATARAETPDDGTVSAPMTREGTLPGTAGYMAPEQVRGESVDGRADLFALGCVLHEMLTGQRAFQRDTAVEALHAVLHDDPPPLPTDGQPYPAGLESLLARCLEKSRDGRFQTASDLSFALGSLMWHGTAMSGGVVRTTARSRGARWRLVAIACVAGVMGTLLAWTIMGRFRRATGDGGQVAYQKLTSQHGHIFNARFSPDEETVLYAATWGDRPLEIYETRPGQLVSRKIDVPSANLLSVSDAGVMAVTLGDEDCLLHRSHARTLAEVPMAGGMPRELMHGIMSADWSPDGKMMAVARVVGVTTRLEMPPDRILFECQGDIYMVAVSPCGRYIAFLDSASRWMDGTVVIVDADGTERARSPYHPMVTGVAWPTDRDAVCYCVSDDMGSSSEVIVLGVNGSRTVVARLPGWASLHDISSDGRILLSRDERIAGFRGQSRPGEEEREYGFLEWSAMADLSVDGKTILFSEQGLGSGSFMTTYVRGMDGSPPMKVGDGEPWTLSPDGKWVIVSRGEPREHLELVPIGAGASVILPAGDVVEYHPYFRPRWLPDGNAIVFNGRSEHEAMRCYIQETSGSAPRAITPEGLVQRLVSPDGRQILVTDSEGYLRLWPIDGKGEAGVLAKVAMDEIPWQFTEDGESVYVAKLARFMQVDLLDLRAGTRMPWRKIRLPDPAGSMIMGFFITRDARTFVYTYCRLTEQLYLVEGIL